MTNEPRGPNTKPVIEILSSTLNAVALAGLISLNGFADFFNNESKVPEKSLAEIEQQTIPVPLKKIETKKTSPLKYKSGDKVDVQEVLAQEIPLTYLESIKKSMHGKTGIVVSKSYHLFFLFENGKFIKTGVVGTAKPGSKTPVGEYEVEKKIEGTHISTENDEPMENSVYYHIDSGHAIHGSLHFKDGFVEWDSSHGCVNVSMEDSKMIFKVLSISKRGKRVFVKIID